MQSYLQRLYIMGFPLVILAMAGCSTNYEVMATNEQLDEKAPVQEKAEEVMDEELTAKVNTEDQVIYGKVFTRGPLGIGAIIVEDYVEQAEIDAIAKKYSLKLKRKHQNKLIKVLVVQGGERKASVMVE